MALQVLFAAAQPRRRDSLAQLAHETVHARAVGAEFIGGRIDVRPEDVHHQPQQSVLKPQRGQRQTACMRNISALHRSQIVGLGAWGLGLRDWGVGPKACGFGRWPWGGVSGMRGL